MTTPLNTILSYQSLDLTPFEIRGVKSGMNNAYSTGPVYDGGVYNPPNSTVLGSDGSFSPLDSTVRNFTGFSASSLQVADKVIANDTTFTVTGILSSNSFGLNAIPTFEGIYQIILNLGSRDYIVEPDSLKNTLTGLASFTSGSKVVDGTSTLWSSQLAPGDFIKADYYQQYYKIDHTVSNTSLVLTSPFAGDTSSTSYTAKRWAIGRTDIQYSNNDVTLDTKSGRWKYDATTGSEISTSLSLSPLADGIDLAFTKTIVQNAPDLMDIAVVTNKVFSQKTQYDTFQYSLPVVPYPEESFSLKINDIPQVRNQDYALNYTQNPIYSPPPPPSQRFVANLMFLKELDATPSTSVTETGNFYIIDAQGKPVNEILPGSEHINIGGFDQVVYRDYILEPNAGAIDAIESVIGEPIVKYVATDYSDKINHGFSVTLNGNPQKVSYPAESTDDILFQFDFGRLKPAAQDHPGIGDVYEVNYMVEATTQTQVIKVTTGTSSLQTALFPIEQGSIFLQKNQIYLNEDVDFAVSYLTGWVYFVNPLVPGDLIDITYTPLSKQVNDLTYSDGTSYCTVLDSRLQVNGTSFQFGMLNTRIDASSINVLRVFNESREAEYSLAGIKVASGGIIQLSPDTLNVSIGISPTDVVLADYIFPNETTEYAPIFQNLLQIKQGTSFFYFEGIDLTSEIIPGTVVSAKMPDGATQFFFLVNNVSYDLVGTKVSLASPIPADLTNPKVFVADDSVNFYSVGYAANPIISGSTNISFVNANIVNLFRSKTLIEIGGALYQALSASYDPVSKTTIVSLTSEVTTDYTNVGILSSIQYSDSPVYLAGDTEIIPSMPIITLVKQPVFTMTMTNASDRILQVTSDSSGLTVDGTAYPYSSNTYISDMSASISSANIAGLVLNTYVPGWQSNKIISGQNLSVYTDSNTLLNASDALRYRYDGIGSFIDTTSFTISNAGTILLTNPLSMLDRYELDYMGRKYLYDNQVKYSLRYFVTLPAKSKVTASFQYNNLDQFYIQVLDQRQFFEQVTIPRMTNEAIQLNGNVGQGGQVSGDSGGQPSDGGIAGDEYRRKDAEIECRVFKNIYDFFEHRLEAFGNEMDAATGLRIFNNDGYFSDSEQLAAFKSVNRIFPFPDYTNMEPVKVNPLTGYFFDTKAFFTYNSTGVHSVGGKTRWKSQLNSGDFIGRYDSTQVYSIATVVSDSSLVLSTPFQQPTTTRRRGDKYTASAAFPLYDDDGYLGPKLIGSESEDFSLSDGDVFDIYMSLNHPDFAHHQYVFNDPPYPSSLFLPGVDELSANSVAQILSNNIPGLIVTAETVLDDTQTFGYRTGLVLRTKDRTNNIYTGNGQAVEKLGFGFNTYAYGNWDRTDHFPETVADSSEIRGLRSEIANDIGPLLSVPNKIHRVDSTNIVFVNDLLGNLIPSNSRIISQVEIPRLFVEIASEQQILQEHLASYVNTQQALIKAIDADTSAYAYFAYDTNIISTYEGKEAPWAWALDFSEQSQIIHGVDSTGIGVPIVGPGDTTIASQNSFILYHPGLNDLRILNSGNLANPYYPVVVYENNGQVVDGTWTNMDPTVSSEYSLPNAAIFTVSSAALMTIAPDPLFTTPNVNATATSLGFNWTSSVFSDWSFMYVNYPNLSDMVNVVNNSPGFFVTPGIYSLNYDYTDLSNSGTVPQIIYTGPNSPAFSFYYNRADTTAYYDIDTTAIVITKYQDVNFVSRDEFLYTSYPTLGQLETGLRGVSDTSVETMFDPSYSYGSLASDSGTVSRTSPGTYTLFPAAVPLFTVDFDMQNASYATNPTSLILSWFTNSVFQSKAFDYGTETIYDLKASINNSMASLMAYGPSLYDADFAASFNNATGFIFPSANFSRGLRDCTVAYQTISDRILNNRDSSDTVRIGYLTDRTDYLGLSRENQIKNDVVTEQILRNSDGGPSDLYVWANNRFNRRQGCYSRLNQIQQQIASNQSALNINKSLTQ